MGKFYVSAHYYLGIACLAAFAFPSLANAAIERIGYDGATTSYYVQPGSIGTGPGVQVVRESGAPQIEKMPNGGLSQRMPAGVIIDAKQVKAPFSAYFRAAPSAAANALKRCFTSLRCNFALAAAGAGIDALFDGLDWVMGPGGQIQRRVDVGSFPSQPPNTVRMSADGNLTYSACNVGPVGSTTGGYYVFVCEYPGSQGRYQSCRNRRENRPLVGYRYGGKIGDSNASDCYYGLPGYVPPLSDVPESEIVTGIESNYVPEVSDWDFIAPGFDPAVDDVSLDFDVPDPLTLNPTFTEIFDSEGNLVGSEGTLTFIEFEKVNAPGPRPDLNVKITEETVTLSPEGAVTGREEKTQNINPVPGASDSGGVRVNVNVPTDCNFMPTVCRFIAWFTEPDPNPEPELSDLINDIEIEREFTVGTDTAACPAPFTIPLSWFGDVEVSLDPFCNLADALRPLLLSLAFVYSGLLILRT